MNSFKLSGVPLSTLDHKEAVPNQANEIILPNDDKKAIAIGITNNLPILLIGEAGTGKTSIARHIAYKRKQGYVRISMTGYATPDELIGSKSVKNGSTYYEDGVLTKAMRNGHLVVLDEINATPPDCLFILHGLLDDDRQITLPNGDIVKPHPDFRFIATMNPDYEGTKSLNRAFLDRFSIILTIGTLTPKKEEKLLTDRYKITSDTARKMVLIAWQIRKAYAEQKTLTYTSTRTLLQWADLISQGISTKQAYITCVVNKTRNGEKESFMDFFNAVHKTAPDGSVPDDTPVLTTEGELRRLKNAIDAYMKKIDEDQNLKSRLDADKNFLTIKVADLKGELETERKKSSAKLLAMMNKIRVLNKKLKKQ